MTSGSLESSAIPTDWEEWSWGSGQVLLKGKPRALLLCLFVTLFILDLRPIVGFLFVFVLIYQADGKC